MTPNKKGQPVKQLPVVVGAPAVLSLDWLIFIHNDQVLIFPWENFTSLGPVFFPWEDSPVWHIFFSPGWQPPGDSKIQESHQQMISTVQDSQQLVKAWSTS
jgi:hypothetical protein